MTAPVFLEIARPSASFPGFFRFREVDGAFVVTNAQGDFILLTREEFKGFVEGTIERGTEMYERLKRGNFLRAEFDVPAEYLLVCGVSLGYPSDHPVNTYDPGRSGADTVVLPPRSA